jgi:hypothetical protein
MSSQVTDKNLQILSLLNTIILILHIYINYTDIFYFFQLTILGQILIIINFILSIIYHNDKENISIKIFLSRIHLITIALEGIVVLAFWGLRYFFRKGIIN